MLQELNGMFAFAVWDAKKRQLLLARDHVGIKPLYYWQDRDRIYFASEIKALLRIPEIPRELNVAAVPQYLTFLWVPGDETMLRGIRKLEPGHYLLWKDGRAEVKPWFSLDYEPDYSVSESRLDRAGTRHLRPHHAPPDGIRRSARRLPVGRSRLVEHRLVHA